MHDQTKPSSQNLNGFAIKRVVKWNRSETDRFIKRRDLDEHLPIPKLRFYQAAITVFIVAVLCFCNSYDGAFVFDDRRAILENKDLLPETPLTNLLINDFWGNRMVGKTSHKSYRPLTVLSFRLSYYLGGGHSRPCFHIPNILLHGIVSVLLLRVFSVLIGGYAIDTESGRLQFRSAKSALLCALLFVVHPIHTESVSANVGRADLLCALLFLLSFLSYVKGCAAESDQNNNRAPVYRPTHFSAAYILGSMFLCFLSVLCKEQGITVIISSANPWILSLIKRHVFLVTSGVVILLFRCSMMGTTPPHFLYYDNPHSFQNGTLIRGLNYNYLYSLHSWLLVHPLWLCCDWSMGSVPVLESFRDPRIFSAIALWIALGVLLFKSLKTPITKDQRHIMIALAFIIIPFLPASNVFFRVGFVVAERVLYLPSVGFCLLVVLGVRQMCAIHSKYAQKIQWMVTALIFIFMLRCMQIHFNIGKMAADGGDIDLAEEKYRLAIKTADANAWLNLGRAKKNLKKYAEAEKCFGMILKYQPNNGHCYVNLGNLYLELQQFDRAVRAWTNATILDPKLSSAWTNMAFQLDVHGRLDESISVSERGLKHLPDEPGLHFNLGNIYGKQGRWMESEKEYLKALKLSPNKSLYYGNFGSMYARWGKYDLAEENYRKALAINPNETDVKENLAKLHKLIERKMSII